MNQLLDP